MLKKNRRIGIMLYFRKFGCRMPNDPYAWLVLINAISHSLPHTWKSIKWTCSMLLDCPGTFSCTQVHIGSTCPVLPEVSLSSVGWTLEQTLLRNTDVSVHLWWRRMALLKGRNKLVKRPACVFIKWALTGTFGYLKGVSIFCSSCFKQLSSNNFVASKLLTVLHKSFQEFHLDCAAYPNDI